MITIKLLNEMFGHFMDMKFEPLNVKLGDNPVTPYRNSQDAFILNSPISGSTRSVKTDFELDADGGIIRAVFGFELATKMVENFLFGIFILSIFKNEMLIKMSEKFDVSKNEWTFKFANNTYFRELENSAGFEIRLHLTKRKEPDMS